MEPQKSTRRSPKGERKREAIIEAATRLFAQRGYERVRIADIAKEVGMTDAGVLYHFSTKAALFTTIVDRREHDYRWDMMDADTVREMFDRSIESVQHAATHPYAMRLRVMLTSLDALEDNPVHGRLERNLERLLPPGIDLFRRGIASGEIRADVNPKHAVLAQMAINEGIRNQWSLDPTIDYVQSYTDAVNMLYRGIAARPLPSRIPAAGAGRPSGPESWPGTASNWSVKSFDTDAPARPTPDTPPATHLMP